MELMRCSGDPGALWLGNDPRNTARGWPGTRGLAAQTQLRFDFPKAARRRVRPSEVAPDEQQSLMNVLFSPPFFSLCPVGVDSFPAPFPTLISSLPVSRGGFGFCQSGVMVSSASPSSPCARWWEPAWCPS